MTLVEYGNGCSIQYFNSHPHEEDDQKQLCMIQEHFYFNSHPHEEDDRVIKGQVTFKGNFNSHPHEEDDCILV